MSSEQPPVPVRHYYWRFAEAGFEPIEIPELDKTDGDYRETLRNAGYQHSNDFGSEGSVEVSIYVGGADQFPWLVDLWTSGYGLGLVVCESLPALLELLRDWVAPVLTMGRESMLIELIATMQTTLFDRDLGLGPVQRVTRRDREYAQRCAEERERLRRAKKPEATK